MPTCEERPFKVLLQYKYAHLYYLRWVTKKAYFLACDALIAVRRSTRRQWKRSWRSTPSRS